jgi:glycosyltransferase involved in cell wall biosynthesis
MHIAYVCADPGVPVFGCKGASVHVQEVIRALSRRGAHVELFATRIGGAAPPGLTGVHVHALPPVGKGDPAVRERAALAANAGLRTALESRGPFDLVYERYSLWSFAGIAYARAAEVPGLLEVNAPLIEEQARYRELVDRAGAVRVAEQAFGAATALVAVSGNVAAYLEGYPAARGRVHTVPNGVDPARFHPGVRPALLRRPGSFTVGFVGSLKPWHGLDVLVDAFASLHHQDSGTRLVIVGDGPERDRTVAHLMSHDLLGATDSPGLVAPDEVPAWLACMDVAVAPYPDLEGFYFSPLKVLEYMAAGIPVVASRIGQLASLIQDDVNGLLCPPADVDTLAARLERLRTDLDLRAKMGAAARATVLHHHTWDAVVDRVLELATLSWSPQPGWRGAS